MSARRLVVGLSLATATAAAAPQMPAVGSATRIPCAAAPRAGLSGLRFVVNATEGAACTLQIAPSSDSAYSGWCITTDRLTVHSESWSAKTHIGTFSIHAAANKFEQPAAHFFQASGHTVHNCISAESTDAAATVGLVACDRKPQEGWVFTAGTPGLVQSAANRSLCLGWIGAPGPAPDPPPPPNGVYLIDTSAAGRKQVFEGVQVELQSDSIGSDNTGMPKEGQLVADGAIFY